MVYRIRKKDLDLYLKNISRILSMCDGFSVAKDCIFPFVENEDESSTNGATIIRSFLPEPIPDGILMVSVKDLPEIVKILKEKKNLKEINIDIASTGVAIQTDDEWNLILVALSQNDVPENAPNSHTTFDELLDVTTIKSNGTSFTQQQLSDARSSKPVTLSTEYGKVRISRNLFPLTGPIKKTGPVPFSGSWTIHIVKDEDNNVADTILVLYMKYKDLDAFHMYSIIPY